MKRTTALAAMLGLAAAVITACSDSPTQPSASPLAGLAGSTTQDSAGGTVPQPPTSTTPGTFHGTVLGQSPPGSGNDTLATSPRLAGVVVTAYPATSASSASPTLGAPAATVTTGADGKFELPSLPGGSYAVTFTPPAGSAYAGTWVTGTASATSGNFAWWVVLNRK